MRSDTTPIPAGAITFVLQHRDLDGGAGGGHADQGVCIQVVGEVDGQETGLLRFDCLDHQPSYTY